MRHLNLHISAGERVLLLGSSGIGKSTILEGAAGLLGKNATSTSSQTVIDEDGGEIEGGVLVDGRDVLQARGRIGLVLQDPQAQAIFQRLGDNVAFGPENLNIPREAIWKLVHNSLESVGLDGLELHRSTSHLSGGQMQRLALAGALAMNPGVLLLDEPTANLDPDGVEQVIRTVSNVVEATQATLVLVEHRAQPWMNLIDRVVILGKENVGGKENHTRDYEQDLQQCDTHNTPNNISLAKNDNAEQTLIIADGKPEDVFTRTDIDFDKLGIWVPEQYQKQRIEVLPNTCATSAPILRTRDLSIGHDPTKPIAKNINITLSSGKVYAFVGQNGAGKSTLSLTLAGLLHPATGSVEALGELAQGVQTPCPQEWKSKTLSTKIAYVFQNPEHQFVTGSVLNEVMLGLEQSGLSQEQAQKRAIQLLEKFGLSSYKNANPYTLSGGEKRRLSVASCLACAPKVIILDEPTFGQDKQTWKQIVALIAQLRDEGECIVVVTHDEQLVQTLQAQPIYLDSQQQQKTITNTHSQENSTNNANVEYTAEVNKPIDNAYKVQNNLPNSKKTIHIQEDDHPREAIRITVSAVNQRTELARNTSPVAYFETLNPVFRMIGALLIGIPLLFSLDIVSASIALAVEFIILGILKTTPLQVIRHTWPVWIGAPGSALAVLLYGKTGGAILWQFGWMSVSELSVTLAAATAIRVLAIGIPAIIMVVGMDATDLADSLSQILHLSDRFVYGGLAGIRLFSVLQDDWAELSASRRSRGLGDSGTIIRFCSQTFALLVLSIRRSTMLATAMEARGFGGTTPRSHARISQVNIRDYICLGICASISIIALGCAVYYNTFAFMGN
ncbi:MAG: ATP-binding cassette domain-containing protein [Bifidobacteriaceae bacterium]|nr:ATP-binding cassette domain-containing protein [Bifidobacteriaceae bacterium]